MDIDNTPDQQLPIRILKAYLELAQDRLPEHGLSNTATKQRAKRLNCEQEVRAQIIQEAVWLLEAAAEMDLTEWQTWQHLTRDRHPRMLVYLELTYLRKQFARAVEEPRPAQPPLQAAPNTPAEDGPAPSEPS